MTGSLSSVLTMGLGSWGSPGLMLTLGYGIAQPAAIDGRLEYTVGRSLLGYAVRPGVIGYTPARSQIGYEVRR